MEENKKKDNVTNRPKQGLDSDREAGEITNEVSSLP